MDINLLEVPSYVFEKYNYSCLFREFDPDVCSYAA